MAGIPLKTVSADDRKPRVHHCTDTVGASTTYFVVEPPRGYRLEAVVPDEKEHTLVNRWRRMEEHGGLAGTLTLTRLTLQSWSAEEAVENRCKVMRSKGWNVDESKSIRIDGEDGATMSWTRDAKDASRATRGWSAVWRSGEAVYAVVGETAACDGADVAVAEFEEVVEKLQIWSVR